MYLKKYHDCIYVTVNDESLDQTEKNQDTDQTEEYRADEPEEHSTVTKYIKLLLIVLYMKCVIRVLEFQHSLSPNKHN